MPQAPFVPRPGQIDFSKARWAPVVNCILRYQDRLLLVQRSADLVFYPGYWNGISGFLDDQKNLKEKVEEELKEEVGIKKGQIKCIQLGQIFDQESPKYKKTWIVHPVLVDVTTEKVTLDWEGKNFAWLKLNETKAYKLLPGCDLVLEKIKVFLKK
jgi:ADP-ribose pyrophosphatase YjhB (NUDIX family)